MCRFCAALNNDRSTGSRRRGRGAGGPPSRAAAASTLVGSDGSASSSPATVDAGSTESLVTFAATVDLDNSSTLRVLLPTRVVAREMKGSPDAFSPATLEHLSGAPTATAAQAGTR
jgi:hypothetical protein